MTLRDTSLYTIPIGIAYLAASANGVVSYTEQMAAYVIVSLLTGPRTEELRALLAASCAAEVTTEQVYLALITPANELNDEVPS